MRWSSPVIDITATSGKFSRSALPGSVTAASQNGCTVDSIRFASVSC